jgi:glutathione S-transferase
MEGSMPDLKLTYFDMHAGRGEPIRLALALANIPFEDDRVPFSEWPERRTTTPFHQVPTLEVDGRVLTQTNSISRYVGKLAGLYPEDAMDAARCDEIMDVVEDILHKVRVTFDIEDPEEKRRAREALAEGPISLYLGNLERMLERGGGVYFAGGELSMADLKVFVWVRSLQSGILDHIPADLVERVAPGLAEHCRQIGTHPGVEAYYERFA